jgi:hypothetical protein
MEKNISKAITIKTAVGWTIGGGIIIGLTVFTGTTLFTTTKANSDMNIQQCVKIEVLQKEVDKKVDANVIMIELQQIEKAINSLVVADKELHDKVDGILLKLNK